MRQLNQRNAAARRLSSLGRIIIAEEAIQHHVGITESLEAIIVRTWFNLVRLSDDHTLGGTVDLATL